MSYVPTLPNGAFWQLPDGVVLPGSPRDYHFRLFAIPELGRFEREEAAGRMLAALATHEEGTTWMAVDVLAIAKGMEEEVGARADGRKEHYVSHSISIYPQRHEMLLEGFQELFRDGLLADFSIEGDEEEDVWYVYPTPELLELMAPYRVAQPVG